MVSAKILNVGRISGSVLLVIGYVIMLNLDTTLGLLLRVVANSISLPWAIYNKVWDLVVLVSFFAAIEIHQLTLILTR